jgi:hypothetical protein
MLTRNASDERRSTCERSSGLGQFTRRQEGEWPFLSMALIRKIRTRTAPLAPSRTLHRDAR